MEDVKTTKIKRIPLSELITILQKKIAEVGDVEITVVAQEDASYHVLYVPISWTMPDGSVNKTIEIG